MRLENGRPIMLEWCTQAIQTAKERLLDQYTHDHHHADPLAPRLDAQRIPRIGIGAGPIWV